MQISFRRLLLLAAVVAIVVMGVIAFPTVRDPAVNLFRRLLPLPEQSGALAVEVPRAPTVGDWFQWRGPNRDGLSPETGLLKDWPEGGPKLLWTFEDGGTGYSAPAVVGDTVFLPGGRDGVEYLRALDARTGEPRGEVVITRQYENSYGGGPRGTPAYRDGKVYALGGDGTLVCVEVADGKVAWRRNLYHDLGGPMPGWGCGESPLLDGDRLLCTPGGREGTVAALDRHTGELLWRSRELTDEAAYSSLMPAEIHGVRQYVQMTFQSVAGVAADDGRLLWRFPREGRGGPNAPIPTPIVASPHVYVTSGYGLGCHLLRIEGDAGSMTPELVYATREMENQHGGVVRVGDHLYGYSESRRGSWVCQEFATGKIVWTEQRRLGKGCVTAADGRLYCYAERDGTVCLAAASPEGWQEHGRFTIPRESGRPRRLGRIWTHPVIAGGRLYLRDQELLFCYDIRAGSGQPD